MSFTQKLLVYALAVALLPLAGTGFRLIAESEQALRTRIDDEGRARATAVATHVSAAIEDVGERAVVALTVVDPLALNDAERRGLVRLLLSLSEHVVAAGLVDVAGQPLMPLLLRNDEDVNAVTERLLRNAPPLPDVAQQINEAIAGQAYYPSGQAARLAVVVPCAANTNGVAQAFAVMELVLTPLSLRLAKVALTEGSEVALVDAFGRVMADSTRVAGTPMPLAGDQAFVTQAQVPNLGWTVHVSQDKATAFAPVRQMRQRIFLGLLVTFAVVLASGLLFASRLRRRIFTLVQGARAFGAQRLRERVPEESGDELGELATTMNQMADALLYSLEEIAAWNRTLEDKVLERTEELRATQAQLLMQSKLAAIGQLGAGVAHEVNNPLAGILGYTQLLLRKHPEGDAEHASLKRIEEAAQRCSEVTTSLLRFSQRGLGGRMHVSLNDVVNEVIQLVSNGLAELKIQVHCELAKNLPHLHADAGQLALVITNLVSNAKNAMPQGGVLRIATFKEADGIRLEVGDTGVGIAPEHLQRVFEPFFTTKTVWTGVGLGLSLVYRVVTDHGGTLAVDSTLGVGTVVQVCLPLSPPSSQGQRSVPVAQPVGL